MDIQKEREVFEKLPDINAILHNSEFGFNEGINQYYHPNHAEHRLSYAFLMGAWLAWQAKAQAVPEWISVEDKLPTENGNYLVCIDGDVFYLTAKWVKNHFKFLARGYGLTEDFTDWRYCEGVKVTHWMTLPAAPQEPTND
ncbi:DUF551 domain-containing protein [Acinetobacter johnsonii]|uniref:DUF551 domain-containing protein n=1 Tax=Acinetobacter johnsonii TaxID=40214 RepID=UPI003D185F6E